jgi:hypothetical protein
VAQLRLGALDEARASFERAAELDAKLIVPSQYYRGVVAYQARRFGAAEEHFEAVVAVQPDSDMGREAREFLVQLAQGYEKPFRVYGATAFQYDSNVTLDTDLDQVSNDDDGRFTLTAGGAYVPLSGERLRLQVGYEFFQSLHFNSRIADDFDVQNHRPEVQLSSRWEDLRFGTLLRYDYYAHGRGSDFRNFLQQGTAIPWFVWDERQFGRTEVYYRFRLRDFLDGDLEERDSYNHAPGLRQFVYLGSPDNYLSVGYQFDREDPEDDTFPPPEDPNRFAYDGHEVNGGLGWTLPLDVRGELGYAYRRETYPDGSLAANFANRTGATCGGPGEPACNIQGGRLDKVHQLVVAFRRPIGAYVSLIASYFGTFNGSNDEQFEYDRHIGSLGVELTF